jgi:hypothetical protein
MIKKKGNILKRLISDFVIFIFAVYVVSDLINMHLKLIYHIDLFASQNVYIGVTKKVKDEKVKIKPAVFKLFNAADNKADFTVNKQFFYLLYFLKNPKSFHNFYLCHKLICRAPPV